MRKACTDFHHSEHAFTYLGRVMEFLCWAIISSLLNSLIHHLGVYNQSIPYVYLAIYGVGCVRGFDE